MYWDYSGKKLWLYSFKICIYNDCYLIFFFLEFMCYDKGN